MKKILTGLMVLFCVGLLAGTVAAGGKDVSINVNVPSSMSVGDSFTLEVHIKNDDTENITAYDDIELVVYFEGVRVHYDDSLNLNIPAGTTYYYNLSSSNFKVDGDRVWSKNLMDYQCGDNQEFKVEIGGDVSDDEDTDEMDIKPSNSNYELSFSISPETPTLEDEITIGVKDEDGDDLTHADVKVTYFGSDDEWDDSDDYDKGKTDSNGEYQLTLEKDIHNADAGTYQVDVYKSGRYCKETQTFDVSKNLNVSDPEPTTPQAGKTFKVRVTNEAGNPVQGALATLSGGSSPIRSTTDANGYASFTVQSAGSYSLVVGRTGYTTSFIKTVTVSEKPALSASASKSAVSVGESVTITVKADGSAIEGATVKITLPDGTSTSPATGSSGTVSYTPTISGTYSVAVSKGGYSDATTTFKAESVFTISIPENTQKTYGKTTKIKVTDSSGNPVSGASVTIAGTSLSGTTDVSGEYSFTAPAPENYTVKVTKSGFNPKETTLSVGGTLSVVIKPKQAALGETVKITVLSEAGKPVTADLTITNPDGTTETQKTSVLEFSKNKAGKFDVTATRVNFDSATDSFTIKPKDLQLKTKFENNELTITALSEGTAVEALTIQIETPEGEVKTATTDGAGTVLIAAKERGDYTISAVSSLYESGAVTAVKKGINWWLIVLALFILAAAAVVAIVGVVHARRRKKRGSFQASGKSRLGT